MSDYGDGSENDYDGLQHVVEEVNDFLSVICSFSVRDIEMTQGGSNYHVELPLVCRSDEVEEVEMVRTFVVDSLMDCFYS